MSSSHAKHQAERKRTLSHQPGTHCLWWWRYHAGRICTTRYYRSHFLSSSVINRGLTLQFTFQYTDNNRKKLSQYETEEDLLNYLRHQGLVEQFIRFADSKGVKRRNILIQKSYKRLEANIYGNIIYNMLGLEAYLKYFNKSDATVQQGIELLEKGEAFPKAPAETEEEVTKDNKDGKKKRTAQAYGITEDPTRIFDFAEASIS